MEIRPAAGDGGECIGELLDNAVDLTTRFLIDRTELSVPAGFAMNRVCREGPLRLTTLAAMEGVSQPSMTQLMQRLERQGLVTRLADPDDGRAALIGVTDQGQAFIDDRKARRRERLVALLESLSPEDQDTLRLAARVAFPILSRLIENADTATDDLEPPSDAVPGDERKVFE